MHWKGIVEGLNVTTCYHAEEDDSPSPPTPVTTRPPIISDLDKITVLLNGLPPTYQPVIVNITGIPLVSLTFEDVVTCLMNEEGRLHNINSPHDSLDDLAAAVTPGGLTQWKNKSPKSTLSKDMSKVICHKCGGVGHFHSVCPTHDSDAANAVEEDEELWKC